jgi:ribosomal protein S18 acetylase RimI-like enzyme
MSSTAIIDHHYTVHQFPSTSPRITDLVKKYRDTKLAALKADPGSFLARYEVESRHSLSVWHTRLTRQITCLVCVANVDPGLSSEDALLTGEWAGFAAARGRVSFEDYYAYPQMGQPVPERPDLETRWHVYDLYTMPAHRGRSVATRLGESLLSVVAEETLAMGGIANKKARLRLIVDPRKTWLVDGYRRFGFNESGRVTLKQGFVANGMEESVPEDTTSTEQLIALWETPYGMAMEKIYSSA